MQIQDGKGTGNVVGVTSENRILADTIVSTSEHHANHAQGRAYNAIFSATPAGVGDCFFYMKNESEIDIVIEGMCLYMEADQYIELYIDDSGDPVGGNAIVPTNLNSGSGQEADGTFQDGADITGLSGGNLADRIYHANTKASVPHNFEQDIILVKNGVFTMYIQTGGVALHGKIIFNYHNAQS